eukprot:GHVS01045154.1.p1 GENE.GHVS01045154.1~~GHVS01045154.1.p1  ORF type:complete len:273 (-),score=37.34 GHVS01045154.1:376-1194(-)
MDFFRFCSGLLLFPLFAEILGAAMLRDRRGLQSWQASMEGRSCRELEEMCQLSFVEDECAVASSVCYELLRCKPEAQCAVQWNKVLQSYDRELFGEVQGIMWSFFAMRPQAQQAFISTITSSMSGDGGESSIARSIELFDSLAKVLPVVESDLIVQINGTAWESLRERVQQSPEELQNIKMPEMAGASAGEDDGLMSQLTSVFIMPPDFSYGQFLATIQWDKGLLENLGLKEESFTTIVRSFAGEEDKMEALASDLALLVKNVHDLKSLTGT